MVIFDNVVFSFLFGEVDVGWIFFKNCFRDLIKLVWVDFNIDLLIFFVLVVVVVGKVIFFMIGCLFVILLIVNFIVGLLII